MFYTELPIQIENRDCQITFWWSLKLNLNTTIKNENGYTLAANFQRVRIFDIEKEIETNAIIETNSRKVSEVFPDFSEMEDFESIQPKAAYYDNGSVFILF